MADKPTVTKVINVLLSAFPTKRSKLTELKGSYNVKKDELNVKQHGLRDKKNGKNFTESIQKGDVLKNMARQKDSGRVASST